MPDHKLRGVGLRVAQLAARRLQVSRPGGRDRSAVSHQLGTGPSLAKTNIEEGPGRAAAALCRSSSAARCRTSTGTRYRSILYPGTKKQNINIESTKTKKRKKNQAAGPSYFYPCAIRLHYLVSYKMRSPRLLVKKSLKKRAAFKSAKIMLNGFNHLSG